MYLPGQGTFDVSAFPCRISPVTILSALLIRFASLADNNKCLSITNEVNVICLTFWPGQKSREKKK